MKYTFLKRPRWVRYIIYISLVTSLLVTSSVVASSLTIEVIVEDPTLFPPYSTCPDSSWYQIENDRGHYAYLTLNVNNQTYSSNYGEWHPMIPQTGYYRVEAYIAGHSTINWCTSGNPKEHDTADAHYSIHNAYGVVTRELSQYPLSNQWLNLGEYYFTAGDSGYVSLNDISNEANFTTTVSFSAMRFTYTRSTRPLIYLPMASHAIPSQNPPPNVGVVQAQGFDVCSLPSISTMQTWWNESPYTFYGLYLGGIQLPTQCAGATAAWVSAVHQQGWSFIPTWVGPQAPCSPWSKKMSADPVVSYQQGRQEASAASTRAADLGLTSNGTGGTIIYYDMEVYGGASLACRQAASSFMNGWVERLGELGNLAGGYGAHNSYVEDWAALAHVPSDVWAASWYADYYDPYASVISIPWLQGLWTNHQRIRQYAGDHHESWGGIGIAIDSDVADGVVALPPSEVLANPVVISSPPVEDSGWISADQGWIVSRQRLYWTTDHGKNWLDVSPAEVQLAYFLPSGQAWAFTTLDESQPVIYYSTDWGSDWEGQELTLPSGRWKPLQLQFTFNSTGWIVLQKATSQAFNLGMLLKTSDGGLTWRSADLPMVGDISFASQTDGWLMDGQRQQVFQTTDGGFTWQVAGLDDYPFVKSPLPAGTIDSGWVESGLGWAATSNGSCQGEKGDPDFTCQVDQRLWQSQDAGNTWDLIPLPSITPIKQ